MLIWMRKHFGLYWFFKKIYGCTIGMWPLKEFYLKNIGLYNGKRRLRLLNDEDSNKLILRAIKSDKPFMLARYGSTEFKNITEDKYLELLHFYSGFFPTDKKLLKKFQKLYIECSKNIDFLAVWNYRMHFLKKIKLIRSFPNIKYIIPNSIDKINNIWLKGLENKRILVIHPFKKTIEEQMKKRKELGILPKIKSLEVIRAVQTIAGNNDPRFKDWFEALNWMKKEINKKKFDIAIIGCGAYGLPLATHVKSLGKQALHLAGGTQILFGIKGGRWNNDPNVKYTKNWVSPLPEDTPKDFKKIEGGCYW